jgi:transposase InsO family protein
VGWSLEGVQYASAEYLAVLEKHGMIPSMSRSANPYDNASCESFLKTLKREEIYANQYNDLVTLRTHIEEFIDQYYNGNDCTLPWATVLQKNLNSKSGNPIP